MHTFTIIELSDTGVAEDKELAWLKAKTDHGVTIVFWGTFENHANIKYIRDHEPPFTLQCKDVSDSKYADLAIGEDTPIQITA